jgi:FkbM family methyltransferase
MEVRDGGIAGLAWRLPHLAAAKAGPGAARRMAQVLGRIEGMRPGGVQRIALRISPRLADENPGLAKISPAWAVDAIDVRRHGLRLRLDLRDNLQAILYYAGRYEPDTARFLTAELRAGDVLLDVGANIGLHTLGAALRIRDLSSGRVIAFEPARDAGSKLEEAAERNGLAEFVELVQAALGDRTQEAALRADSRYDAADTGVRSLGGDGDVVQQVPVVRLDDWARANDLPRLDVMKLDVEGSELAVLRGAAHTITRLRPRAVLVEDKREDQRRELYDVLHQLGYRPKGLLDHNRLFRRDRSVKASTGRHSLR